MRSATGDVLPFAVVVAASPINIIAAILLLFTRKPVANASGYLVGFAVGVTVVLSAATLLAEAIDISPDSGRSRAAYALLLVTGMALVAAAVRTFRGRPAAGEEAAMPKWMDGIGEFGTTKSCVLGLTVGALNPKNVVVGLATAVIIASGELSAGQEIGVVAVYAAIASLGVAVPIVAMLVLGERADDVLDDWKSWLARNNAVMMSLIYLLFGAILIGKGIGGI